jgi:ABC-type multidrug transport system fused ATPase/permease subunit
MRYPPHVRQEIEWLLRTHFKTLYNPPTHFDIPADFLPCYHTSALTVTLHHILFAFENKRNILLVGESGSGLTYIARWAAEYYGRFRAHSLTGQ